MPNYQKKSFGFTLIDMLLVIFLVGLVASSMILIVDDKDDQNRYDETRLRYQNILDAIIGTSKLNLNDSPLINGFIADMGRLPTELSELITQPTGSERTLVSLIEGDGYLITQGWRGPYLSTFNQSFKDAWGGDFSYDDSPALSLQSLGKDRLTGTVSDDGDNQSDSNIFYEKDFPADADVHENLYKISGGTLTFQFINDESDDADNATHLIVGILYPGLDTDDLIGGDDDGDGTPYHKSIVLAHGDNDKPYEINGATTHSIPFPDVSPYIRKFQFVVYYRDDGTEPTLPTQTTKLEDLSVAYVDNQVFQIIPQYDGIYTLQINLADTDD